MSRDYDSTQQLMLLSAGGTSSAGFSSKNPEGWRAKPAVMTGWTGKSSGRGNVVQAEAVPDHDVGIDQRPVRGRPGRQAVAAAALVGIAAGRVDLVGMIGRDPELPGHEGGAPGHASIAGWRRSAPGSSGSSL